MSRREPIQPGTLALLAQIVESRTGLYFAGSRGAELVARAAHVFEKSDFQTWETYVAHLSHVDAGAMFTELIEALTVGETYFFRHRAYFDVLERTVLPELIAQRREARQLRVWCAGCATGEEAYSVAILLRRLIPDVRDWRVTILATDLNRGYLARARAGVYGEWSFRETDATFRTAHFTVEGGRFRIRPEFRELVQFAHLNLAVDSYPSPVTGTTALDLVLCRNVLIYFTAELAQQVVGRLHAALVPGGWLVLGPSDPSPSLLSGFEMRAADGAILYQKRDDRERATVPWPAYYAPVLEPGPTVVAIPVVAVAAPEPLPGIGDWQVAWRTARASADGGRLDEAEAHCHQAIVWGSLRPEPYYLLGTLRQARGDDQAALAAFRQALYADGAFVPALLGQATLYRRGGDAGRARHSLDRARRLLDGRDADEPVLAEEGLTVGRLRDALLQALGNETVGRT